VRLINTLPEVNSRFGLVGICNLSEIIRIEIMKLSEIPNSELQQIQAAQYCKCMRVFNHWNIKITLEVSRLCSTLWCPMFPFLKLWLVLPLVMY